MTGEMHRRHFLIGLIAGTAGAKISDIANVKGGTVPIIRPEKMLTAHLTEPEMPSHSHTVLPGAIATGLDGLSRAV